MSETREFKKGSVIFNEGAWEMTMFVIRSGKAAIYANFGKENEQLLTEVGAGKIIGEMGLLEARPRSATAVAAEDSVLEVVNGDGLSAFFENEPEKVVDILVNMTGRLRELSEQYVNACKTISEYVHAEKKNKPTFWERVKDLLGGGGEEFSEMYTASLRMGFDPLQNRYEWF